MNHHASPAPVSARHPSSPRRGLGIHRSLAALCVAVSLTLSSGLAQQLEQGQLTVRPQTAVTPPSEIEALAKKSDAAYLKLAALGPELDEAITAFERDPSEANSQALAQTIAKNSVKAGEALDTLAKNKRDAARLAAINAKECGSSATLLRKAEDETAGHAAGYHAVFQTGAAGLRDLARELRASGTTNEMDLTHSDRVRIFRLIKTLGVPELAHKWLKNAAETTAAARQHLELMQTQFQEQSDWFTALAEGFAADKTSFSLIATSIGQTTAALALSQRFNKEFETGQQFVARGVRAQHLVGEQITRIPLPLTPGSIARPQPSAMPTTGLLQQLERYEQLAEPAATVTSR